MDAKERFLRYVTYYTTSDDSTGTSPSTERQKDLGRLLMKELDELGLTDIRMDAAGNVLATLPAKDAANAPVLALIAHMDTAPDAPGEHVKPRIVRYEGGELKLNNTVSLTEALCPGISQFIGKELIVTDGTTLLGADDKAGVAEIMAAVEQLISSGAAHGELRVIFTTDEEIGNGVDGLDVESLGCDLGYTVDGGAIDEFEYENFNAADAVLTVHGIGVHPGSAKDVMVNAAAVAMEFAAMLPTDEVPEKTEGYEGFFHLHDMSGSVTEVREKQAEKARKRDRFAYDQVTRPDAYGCIPAVPLRLYGLQKPDGYRGRQFVHADAVPHARGTLQKLRGVFRILEILQKFSHRGRHKRYFYPAYGLYGGLSVCTAQL